MSLLWWRWAFRLRLCNAFDRMWYLRIGDDVLLVGRHRFGRCQLNIRSDTVSTRTAACTFKIRYPLSGRLRIRTTITNTWKIMDIPFQLFLQSVRSSETSRRRTKISPWGRNLNNYSLFTSSYLSFLLLLFKIYDMELWIAVAAVAFELEIFPVLIHTFNETTRATTPLHPHKYFF